MKKLFYPGILLFILFEVSRVYLIMPMPGSQHMDTIGIAYFLHTWRWAFRALFTMMIIVGFSNVWKQNKWLPLLCLAIVAFTIGMFNLKMVADKMFLQSHHVVMADSTANVITPDRLVLGVNYNGEARAYPIQFLAYHHQVRDTIDGKPIMVTYCSVCRSGRVFEPMVNGKTEIFRLVGMDHFNAMFEDQTTKSWWRQENGEAVAGPLKGNSLPEFPSTQTSLKTWLQLYPNTRIMQPDTLFKEDYEDESDFEAGRRKGKLTVYDTTSWHNKSWIAGVTIGNESRAYDWNELKAKKIINDVVNNQPIVVIITDQDRSLIGFKRKNINQQLQIVNDTLTDGVLKYDYLGNSIPDHSIQLDRITVYQEYWHSWLAFHTNTTKYTH